MLKNSATSTMALHCRYLPYAWRLVIAVLLLQSFMIHAQITDSTMKAKIFFRGTASFSATGQQNWYGSSDGAVSISAGTDIRYRRKKGIHRTEHRFRGDIGYMQSADQVWVKNNDQLRIWCQWYKNTEEGHRTGYTARLSTQWLSTWKPSAENSTNLEWHNGFMNPFNFDFSYDFTRPLLTNSRLMVSLATVSINGVPSKNEMEREGNVFLQTPHSHIRSRYGCSLQLMMDETFRDGIFILDHQSALVANALSADGLHLDIQNRFSIKLFRYLQLRFDTRLLYEPDFSHKLQFRQEVLLGVFYEADR